MSKRIKVRILAGVCLVFVIIGLIHVKDWFGISGENVPQNNSANEYSQAIQHIKESFSIEKRRSFYEDLKIYLHNTDSLDVDHADTVFFESEQDCYFSPHTDVNILSNGDYIISENYPAPFVAEFSRTGEFIRKIGRCGNGPGEYQDPTFVDIKDDTIYCYDIGKKVIRYWKDGRVIDEYKTEGRSFFCKDFSVLPYSGEIVFYNIFQNLKPNIFSILRINHNKKILSLTGEYGTMGRPNIVSRGFLVRGLETSREGYVFAVEPQKYGFYVFDDRGAFQAFFTDHKFKPLFKLEKISKIDMTNEREQSDLFWSHSRFRYIHYLGKGIIGITVENPKKKRDKTIPFYYTFWRADGEYLGCLKCPHRIVSGSGGTLYFWNEELTRLENGMYGNPQLVAVKVF